jgi:Tfp pilus assembly protein PilF
MRFVRLGLVALVFAGCATISQKDRELAQAHLGLAQQSLGAGDPRGALAEIETAVRHDPENPEVRNLYGLLLHVAFRQNERAIEQYRKAIDLSRDYTEAKVNLSAVLMDEGRCQEAIPLLETAREDLLYREPYLIENNLGWCKVQLGDKEGGIRHLQNAVSLNPGFCLGYRNLGQVMETDGRLHEALHFFGKYAEKCPHVAEAHHRLGLVHLELGDEAEARKAFLACAEKGAAELSERCAREAALLGGN